MKILQLSTYPTQNLIHGGQIRVSQIKHKLEQLGNKVLSLSISTGGYSAYHPDNDLVLDNLKLNDVYGNPYCGDLQISITSKTDEVIVNFLKQHIDNFKPDIIFFEHHWLWPAVEKFLKDGIIERDKICVVYSSHNIESKLKRFILQKSEIIDNIVDNIVEKIYLLEKSLITAADFIICTTKSDEEFCKKNNPACKTFLVPNAVEKYKGNSDVLEKVKDTLQNTNFALFIGSAHPPNASGFWDMLGVSLARFQPNQRIIVAGQVGDILMDFAPKGSEIFSYVNNEILLRLGIIDQEILSSLIELCDCIILPITVGGGSNLKTAEAIASCKPVVATSIACRGFDITSRLSNFFIHDDTYSFCKAVTDILNKKMALTDISLDEKKLRESVYWDNTLKPLEQLLEEINIKLHK